MQQFGNLRRFMQHPVLNVIGMLGATGATKIGYAGLAAETIMTFLMIYVSAIILSVIGVLGSRCDGTESFDCIPIGDEIPPSIGHGRVKQTS